MMRLEKNISVIVLRVNDYKNHLFIEEHKRIIERNSYVWMLKIGRPLAEKSINTVLSDGGNLILKEPKKDGGKYYFCKIDTVEQGPVKADYVYPEYYNDFDPYEIPLRGTWIKIRGIVQIDDSELEYFELIKGRKKMTDIVNSTRSPILFVQSRKSFVEVEGKMKEET